VTYGADIKQVVLGMLAVTFVTVSHYLINIQHNDICKFLDNIRISSTLSQRLVVYENMRIKTIVITNI